MRGLVSIALLGTMVVGGAAQSTTTPRPYDAAREKRLEWFREAKYGLFIHWGLYAIPAGEWKGQRCLGLGTQREGTTRVDAAIKCYAAWSVLKRAALDQNFIGVDAQARCEVADHARRLAARAKPHFAHVEISHSQIDGCREGNRGCCRRATRHPIHGNSARAHALEIDQIEILE